MITEDKVVYSIDIDPRYKVVVDALMGFGDKYRVRNFIAEVITLAIKQLHDNDINFSLEIKELAEDALELSGFDFINNDIPYKLHAMEKMGTLLADMVNTWSVHLLIWNVPLGLVDVAFLSGSYVNFIITKDDSYE